MVISNGRRTCLVGGYFGLTVTKISNRNNLGKKGLFGVRVWVSQSIMVVEYMVEFTATEQVAEALQGLTEQELE